MGRFGKCATCTVCFYMLFSFLMIFHHLHPPSVIKDGSIQTELGAFAKGFVNVILPPATSFSSQIPQDAKNISASEFLTWNKILVTEDQLKNRTRIGELNYVVNYEPFNLTEPLFITEEDKKQFYSVSFNLQYLGEQPKHKLLGIIRAIPDGVANMNIDCGWPSKFEEFMSSKWTSKTKEDILSPLLVPESNAFQHFLDGSLPKLVQSYNIIMSPGVKVLILQPRDSIIFEILQRLNFTKDKLVIYSPYSSENVGANLQINTCVTPPLHPMLWQKGRSMLGAPAKLPVPLSESHVILLTRAGSFNGGRNMNNQAEVEELLKKRYSSRLVIFQGGYTLKQSIEIFGKSSILIGVHGGALYNLNFAPSGTHVVEILPMAGPGEPIGNIAHTIIWHMAQLLDQKFWRIHQKSESFFGDIDVDLIRLKKVLDKIDALLEST